MPRDAAYRLGHHAPVEHGVRRAFAPRVSHAHLPVPRDVHEPVDPAHVPAPERAHPPELLLERLRRVPAVQEHLLQVDHVPSKIESIPQRHAIHRVQRLARHGLGQHTQVLLDEGHGSLIETVDVIDVHVEGALAGVGRVRGADVRAPLLDGSIARPPLGRGRVRSRNAHGAVGTRATSSLLLAKRNLSGLITTRREGEKLVPTFVCV